MTPGFRSTEWWHSAFCSLLGAVLCVLGLLGRDALLWPGVALLTASAFAYAHTVKARKTPRPYLTPGGKL